jgi:hypothetical protein
MRMTLEEFLRWDDGTEMRYELLGGLPAAIPLSIEAQRMLAVRLATRIDARLSDRRPCNAQFSASVISPDCTDTFFLADLAATCAPIEAAGNEGPAPNRRVLSPAPNGSTSFTSPQDLSESLWPGAPVHLGIDLIGRDQRNFLDRLDLPICRELDPIRAEPRFGPDRDPAFRPL